MSGFHPRDLINEVRIRPGIYNKDVLEHPARKHKQRLWLEVAERLTPAEDWETFSDVEKEVRMGEIATKWKNLKDHFYREIKLEEAGEASKKRKYVYYDDMEFMRPYVGFRLPLLAHNRAMRAMKMNNSTQEAANSDIDIDMDSLIEDKKEVFNNTVPPERPTRPVRSTRSTNKVIKHTKSYSSSTPLTTTRVQREQRETARSVNVPKRTGNNSHFKIRDGDIAFCLSLVPTLRKMTDGHKLRAKIELLQVLHWYVEDMERRDMNTRAEGPNHSIHNNSNSNSNTPNVSNNIEYDEIEEDMVADYLEEYEDEDEDSVNVKQEPHYNPVNSAGSSGGGNGSNNGKVWWT